MPSELKPMRVEVDELDAEKLKARTGRATVAAAIRELARDEKEVYFTYPANGGEATLPIGKTTLDLQTGEVSMPDGTTDRLSTSLKVERREYAKSVFIKADQSVDVSLDGGGEFTLEPADFFVLPHQSFRGVYITTTAETNIKFWASTHPEGVLGLVRRVLGETPTIYNVTLTAANTEYSQALPSNTKKFTVQCRTAFDVKLAFTEGESGTTYVTIKANTNYYEDGILAESLTLYMQSTQAGVVMEIIPWT